MIPTLHAVSRIQRNLRRNRTPSELQVSLLSRRGCSILFFTNMVSANRSRAATFPLTGFRFGNTGASHHSSTHSPPRQRGDSRLGSEEHRFQIWQFQLLRRYFCHAARGCSDDSAWGHGVRLHQIECCFSAFSARIFSITKPFWYRHIGRGERVSVFRGNNEQFQRSWQS